MPAAPSKVAQPRRSTAAPTRRTRAVSKPQFQEPLIPAKPAEEPEPVRRGPVRTPKAKPEPAVVAEDGIERPSDYNGIPIVREEPIPSPLPKAPPFRISRLILADGTKAHACRDCLYTADTRGDVMAHRNSDHGSRYGKNRPKVLVAADANKLDLVLPPRADGKPAPNNAMEMTLAEIISLAPSLSALGDLIDCAQIERDAAIEELRERESHDRENGHKVAVYESLQEEVVSLRLMVKNVGSYEAMKKELLELRQWKKKMIDKLKPLGFVLSEEDE